jgi:outer membrane protein OmpA-like peptidoglycan-associated protein
VIEARYELLQRGMYRYDRNRTRPGPPLQIDKRNPLDLYEARNALMIARAFGAEQYAPDVYQKALGFLNQAEDYSQRKQPVRAIQTVARNAVQTAEDARAITVRRMDEERIAMERKRTEDRRRAAETKAREEEASRLEAEERARTEAAQRATAEQGRLLEEQRRVQAETDRARADQQRTALEERLKQEAASRERIEQERAALEQRLTQERAAMEQRIAQEAESRQAAERAKAEAEAAAAQASRLKAEAETAQRQLAEQQQLARAEADRARASADEADRLRQQAERDRQAAIKDRETLRNELRQQFSSILETRDTARGLIVNISDVLFDTGQYTLRPAAREKLARLAGIVLAHPGLHLQLEGHTDSVGSDALNQRLSENRANAVKQYLVSQGVKDANIESRGFGKTQPVASNATAAGRQQNRRVEMVVSGDIIGTPIQTSRTTGQ